MFKGVYLEIMYLITQLLDMIIAFVSSHATHHNYFSVILRTCVNRMCKKDLMTVTSYGEM